MRVKLINATYHVYCHRFLITHICRFHLQLFLIGLWLSICLLVDSDVHLLVSAQVRVGKYPIGVRDELWQEGLSLLQHATHWDLAEVGFAARFGEQGVNHLVTSFLFHPIKSFK